MRTAHLLFAVALLAACATTAPPPALHVASDIAGIRLDMPRDAVRSTLANVATLEREERKRQEVWTLTNDPRFASLIIGYTSDWNVRFVTAVAKPDGVAVPYEQVLDVAAAQHASAGETQTYTLRTGTPEYLVIAIGKPERLEYLSLKKPPQS
jgi:hypothetical protein